MNESKLYIQQMWEKSCTLVKNNSWENVKLQK